MASLTSDDLSPLFRQLRDTLDEGQWESAVRTQRRPTALATPEDVRMLVHVLAPEYGVDPLLVEAVIGLESGGLSGAVSRKGAQGLMQLMPGTGQRFGVTDPFDAEQNIRGGVRYLAYLREQFPGRVDLQLAGYHAGEGAVRRAGGIPDTTDGQMRTVDYVQTILGRYQPGQAPSPTPLQQATAALPGVPVADVLAALPARPATRLETPLAAAQRRQAPLAVPMPSVEAVETKLAEPDALRRLPAPGATLVPRSTGGGSAAPYRPFVDADAIEEAEPTRSVGMVGTGALGAVRRAFEAVPLLSEWAQGRNQPGVVAALATVAQDISALLAPVEQAVRPTILGDPTLWDKTASAFGSSAPGLLLGALAGGGLMGATVAAVTEAGQEAVDVQRQLTPLVGQAEADRRAMKSFGFNLVTVGLTDRLGIFSASTKPLRKALMTVAMNDLQEVVQYDIARRQMWVPATHRAVPQLRLQGWAQHGDRVVQPVVAQDLGEVVLISTVIGGTLGGVMGRAMLQDNARVQAQLHEAQANSEGFTLERGLDALTHPETPPAAVDQPTWQRWAQTVLDLLPEASMAPGPSGILTSERGSLGQPRRPASGTAEESSREKPALDIRVVPLGEKGFVARTTFPLPEGKAVSYGRVFPTEADALQYLADFQPNYTITTAEGTPPLTLPPPRTGADAYGRQPGSVVHRDVSQSLDEAMQTWRLGQGIAEDAPALDPMPSAKALAGAGAGIIGHGARTEKAFFARMGERLAGKTLAEKRAVRRAAQAIFTEQATAAQLPTTERLLAVFQAGGEDTSDWFQGSMDELRQVFGDDAEIVAHLVAAVSNLRTTPSAVDLALKAYAQWKTGQPLALPEAIPATLPNIRRALAGEPLQGEKVQKYIANILGDPEAVMVDTWIMRLFGYENTRPNVTQYRMLQEWISQMAREAHVSPRDMQGALWTGMKMLQGPAPGEKVDEITMSFREHLRAGLARQATSTAQLPLFGDQGGHADLDLLIPLARTLAGGFAGCLTAEDPDDCLSRALVGAGLAASASPRLLKGLWGFFREFKQHGGGFRPLPGGFLTSERGSLGASGQQPVRLPGDSSRTVEAIQADIDTLDAGGATAEEVSQRLGVPGAREAYRQLFQELSQAQQAAAAAPAAPPPPPPPVPPVLPVSPGAPEPSGPTLRSGAEGLTPERYKTPSGQWRIPLRDMPPQELELLDFIRQPKEGAPYGGMKLAGEALSADFERYVRQRESGEYRLLNDTSGLSVQQMADAAEEYGFIPTADKESLLQALDRSISLGHPVYSTYATGTVPLLDDPHVQGAYRAVLDALDAMTPSTALQVGSARRREAVHAEAQVLIASGQWTLDDIRELYPNTPLNDTQASALLQSVHAVGLQVGAAALAYLDSGARVGSREEASLQQTMALLAELDPFRLGVSAAQSRALGILNDPLSSYTQYLNRLREVLANAPEQTMRQIATKLAVAHGQAEGRASLRKLLATAEQAIQERVQAGGIPEVPSTGLAEQLPLTPDPQPVFLSELDVLADRETALQMRAALRALLDARDQAKVARDAAQTAATEQAYAHAQEAVRAYQEAHPSTGREEQLALPVGGLQEPTQPPLLGTGDVLADRDRAAHLRAELMDLFRAQDAARAAGDATALAAADAAHRAFIAAHTSTAAQAQTLERALRPWTQRSEQLPLSQALVQSARPGFEGYFLELWYNGMLSNPATHIANALSNGAVTTWAIPERFLAEQFGAGRDAHVQRGEATAMLYGLTHGILDAWAIAARAFAAGHALSGLSKREIVYPKAFTAAHVGLDPTSAAGRLADVWFEYIGLGSGGRLPSRLLMASDEFFKLLNYRMELNALAYREAVRGGYEGPAFAEHVARVVSSPSLAQLQEAATTFSIVQTFQNERPASQPGERITVTEALQAVSNIGVRGFPVGKVLLPFTQTPTNEARYTMERTPLGFFFASYSADLAAGGARADLARAKWSLGTLTMVAMAGLALSGRLVGRGPEDRDLRAIWLESHPEYSVQLPGGLWVSLERFGLVGMLAGMVGDTVQIAGEAGIAPWERAVVALYYPFLKNIGSKTYMQGLSQFFDAASPRPYARPEDAMRYAVRYPARLAAGLGQSSALLAATARALSPEEVDARGFVDLLYARIPGWRDGVPARRTLGGEKVLYGWGFAPEMLANMVRAFSPMKLGDGQQYAADAEILANRMALSLPPRTLATQAVPQGQEAHSGREMDLRDLRPLTLSAAQYERYVVLAAGNQQEARALGLEIPDALVRQLTADLSDGLHPRPPSPALALGPYLDYLTTTQAYQAATGGTGGGREALFKAAIAAYRTLGKHLLLAQDDALRQQVEQTQIQHRLQQIPLGERPGVQGEMQQGFDAAASDVQRELGLPSPSAVRPRIGADR